MVRKLLPLLAVLLLTVIARADDGYRLWLRYDRIADDDLRSAFATVTAHITLVTPAPADSPVLRSARAELARGLSGLLGIQPVITQTAPGSTGLAGPAARPDGYAITPSTDSLAIQAATDTGVLYGAFALLRELRLRTPVSDLASASAPRVARRLLDHWDNLDRFVERGYAGFSLWDWSILPDYLSPRYRDYARANASLGINGTVLTNVNADALVLTPGYLEKVAALASVFRAYGIRVYLTARFSAPVELGGLPTADPLDPAVIAWWRAKAAGIYALIPDFGGFLVKANSEGQPGPQNYGRTHADGANLLADALAPFGGIVMWRAFVYQAHGEDRIRQAFSEFTPLDGRFRPNVVLQIKNGPLDFQPREPFSPLFGAMPHTPLGLELQITQEYLGQGRALAFLAPLWHETLQSDTFRPTPGATVARIVGGDFLPSGPTPALSLIAGVANTGTDRDWTGHPLAQANWYAFGRLAWDPDLPSDAIATEWTRLTFGPDPAITEKLVPMLLESREAVVDYTGPLGLTGVFAKDHHYGPEPWLAEGRPDWTSVYYHRADAAGIGFDRTATGSDAVAQYAPELAARWSDLATCPEKFLLWFHHVPWDHRLRSGRPLWDEFCLHYQHGVDTVRSWQKAWATLENHLDPETFTHVDALLGIQARDAVWWRDASLLYFQTFSHRPLPPGVEPPAHDLDYYKAIRLHWMPGNPARN